MILVDTSIWVDHFRSGDTRLQSLLLAEQVACHPFVLGELACGNLRRREEVLQLLSDLPMCDVVPDSDVLALLDQRRLFGRGIGWVDTHLLASALTTRFALWTADRPLKDCRRNGTGGALVSGAASKSFSGADCLLSVRSGRAVAPVAKYDIRAPTRRIPVGDPTP